jgi:hypothetical protein
MRAVPRKTRPRNERFIEQAKEAAGIFSRKNGQPLMPSETSIANGTPVWTWRIMTELGEIQLDLVFAEPTSNVFIFANTPNGTNLHLRRRPYCLRDTGADQLASILHETLRDARRTYPRPASSQIAA